MSILPTFRQLEAFVAVARLRSFSRAAETLNMSQPALSQAIAQAEAILATPLFERTKRAVKILPAGEHLLPRAERIIANLEAVTSEIRSGFDPSRGKISISCVSLVATRVLPTAIHRFRSLYPQSSVLVRDDYLDRIVEFLKTGEADLAIASLYEPDNAISFLPLIEDKFYFICPLDHPLSGRSEMNWRDLEGVDFVGMTTGSGVRTAVDRTLFGSGVYRDTIYQVGRVTSIVEIVAQGGGVSVVPALALIDRGFQQKIHFCPMTSPQVKRTIGLCKLTDAPLSPTATIFQKILLSTLQERALDQFPGLKTLLPPSG